MLCCCHVGATKNTEGIRSCLFDFTLALSVKGTISQKMYNGHKQTLVGIDNRQQPQSATEQCPIVV